MVSAFALSVVCVRSVFSEEMFLLDIFRCIRSRRIDHLRDEVHLRDFFKNLGMINSLEAVLAPRERTMIAADHAGNIYRIPAFKSLDDHLAGILFIGFVNLFRSQVTGARNITVEIVRVGRALQRNVMTSLCPARCKC